MSVSLVTRGMGPSPALITKGFSPVAVTIVSADFIQVHGGSAGPLYEDLARSLWIDKYTIRARLFSVNGEKVTSSEEKVLRVENDNRDSFSAKVSENISVTKTNRNQSIFINALEVFKRK